ncbi:MAG: hypothetical protein BWZ10_01687 [candidate division BRC1 bacterium ADurb.BinA364]|nr:MAG: hypothetical protein BWZ10_01687 [candidate division BRC1 bacterium ADurb.BinA364]
MPIVFLATDLLLVWVGVHLEFERYFSPLMVLLGVPVVSAFGLIGRTAPRRVLLAALGAYCLIGWAGPRLKPYWFDCQPFCLFESIRYQGLARDDYPLFMFKTWDEPALAPTANPSAERILARIRESERYRGGGEPVRVACLVSTMSGDNSKVEYDERSTGRIRFDTIQNLADFFGADFALIALPAAPGANYERRRAIVAPLPDEDYRALALVFETPPLRERIGYRLRDETGLPSGYSIRLYERTGANNETAALEEALAIFETAILPHTIDSEIARAGQALGQAGFEEAALAMLDLAPDSGATLEGQLERARRWGEGYARLARWLDRLRRREGGPWAADLLDSLGGEPAPGPGLWLCSAAATVSLPEKTAARQAIQFIEQNHPLYLNAWAAIESLNTAGLGYNPALAAARLAMCRDHYDESQVLERALPPAFALYRSGAEAYWLAKLRRLEILERDQPDCLNTLYMRAIVGELQGRPETDIQADLRAAIGRGGIAFREYVDYALHHALGRSLWRAGDRTGAIFHWRRGGWEGVETMLRELRVAGEAKEYERQLRWAASAWFADTPRGSDAVRLAVIEGLGPGKAAYRAFAEMNSTPEDEERPAFEKLLEASDESGLRQFAAILLRARVNHYSETRQDKYRKIVLDRLENR